MRKFTLRRLCTIATTLLLIFSCITQTQAQTTFPTCAKQPKCVSQDLSVVGAFLTSSACQCTSGGTITATLNMKLFNKTGSTRTSFAFYANLVSTNPTTGTSTTTYITGCTGPVSPSSTSTISFPNQYTFTCGNTLRLTNVFLAWTDASDHKSCPLDFCTISPKCGVPPVDINITPLLSATATTSSACTDASDGSITVNAVGGVMPYTYSRNGSTYQTSNTFANLAAGEYTLYVKDAAGTPCIYSFAKTLGSRSCCVTPTIDSDPSAQTKCDGASSSFSVTTSGGVPAPTFQWQESTNGGTTYTNISNGSPYGGALTSTLTVNPSSAAMSGNKYRCVVTSGTCTPATSTGATLTVNSIPNAPTATYNAPACDANKFTVTISNVISGATYTIKDKDGNNISGVTPGNSTTPANADNFNFGNIPAGSGFQVSSSNQGCPSSAASCGTTQSIANSSRLDEVVQSSSATSVKVAPNPYNDRIRFTLHSSESGRGALELYNIMGQKIKTVFEGYVDKDQTKTIEYNVPFSQRAMMVYVFRIGNQKTAGKLISSR